MWVNDSSKAIIKAKQSRGVIGNKGQTPTLNYSVDIWFDSLKSVANMLSKENQKPIKVIAEQQLQSATQLIALTSRAVGNASITLKTLDGLSIVKLASSGYEKPKK